MIVVISSYLVRRVFFQDLTFAVVVEFDYYVVVGLV